MNHVYRLVWNVALGLWVAVAESAKGKGKSQGTRRRARASLLLLLSTAMAVPKSFGADAGDASVVGGSGSVSTAGSTTTILQASPRLAIDWRSLSTNPGESLVFVQPGASSIALNRIVGTSPSELLGSLTANGQVFILNPNGVLFGAQAQVNVGGLVASTLGMSNADFMAGNHVFSGNGSGSVVNKGSLTAAPGGYIGLLGPQVINEGLVSARLGTALMAAGNKVTLNLSGNSLLGYSVDQGAVNALAENRQLVRADGGAVILTARAMDSLVAASVNNTGVIEARTVDRQSGRILLAGDSGNGTVKVSGTLDASASSGGTGGAVHVTAQKVTVQAGALVDASGTDGGGEVLIGGGWQGKDARVANARETTLEAGSTVRANALAAGNGGTVVAWSDHTTRVRGRIEARGGAAGGDGGQIETSGKQNLRFGASVDASAPKGRAGTLLLDPAAILIQGGAGDGGLDGTGTFDGSGTPGTVNYGDAGPSLIYQSELEGITGANVILEATDSIATAGSFGGLVLLGNNVSLTMRTRNASTDGTGVRGIDLTGSADGAALEFRTQGVGTISLATGTGASPQSAGIQAGKLTTAGGAVDISASGDVSLGTVDTRPGAGTAGNVTVDSGGAIVVRAGSTVHANDLKFTAVNGIGNGAAGAAAIEAARVSAGNTGSGNILLSTAATSLVTVANLGLGYGIRNQATGGNVSLAVSGGGLRVLGTSVSAQGGNVGLSATGASDTHSLEIVNDGATASVISTTDAGNITLGGNLTAGGTAATGGASGIKITQSTIAAGTGAITLTGDAGQSGALPRTLRGVRLDAGAVVGGGGNISVTGRATSNIGPSAVPATIGVEIAQNAQVSSTGGNVTLKGTMYDPSAWAGTGVLVNGKAGSGPAGKLAIEGAATVGGSLGQGVVIGSTGELSAGTAGLTIAGSVSSSTTATAIAGTDFAGKADSYGTTEITGTVNAASAVGASGVRFSGGTIDSHGAALTVRGSGVPAPAPAANRDVDLMATLMSGGGDITILGDRINIAHGVNSGSGRTILAPFTVNRQITLGGFDESNFFNLSNSEIGLIKAAELQVGTATHKGSIAFGGSSINVLSSNVPILTVLTKGGVTQTAALMVGSLNVTGGSVSLGLTTNQIGALSGQATAGNFEVTSGQGGTLAIGTVGATGTVSINATAASISAGAISGSGVTLSAGAGAISDGNGAANNITAASLIASAQGAVSLDTNVSGATTVTTTGAAGDIRIGTANAIDTANYTLTTATGSTQNVSLETSSAGGIAVGNAFASTNDNISLTASAGGIALNGAIHANGLALGAQGTISAPAAIQADGVFELRSGTFSQTGGSLPAFSAGDFRISGGTFRRAAGGDGSAGNPFQIADVYGLQGVGSAGMLSQHYRLAGALDAAGTAAWNAGAGFAPIGTAASPFAGSFDGGSLAIGNLLINRPGADAVGLFGVTLAGSTVANVGLVNASVTGANGTGALVGVNRGSVGNSYTQGSVNGTGDGVGGLAGVNDGGTIAGSYSVASVSAGARDRVGGLVGDNGGTLQDTYAAGAVTSTGVFVGGLAGRNTGTVGASFWNIDSSLQGASAGGTGLIAAQFTSASTFDSAGWDVDAAGGTGATWRVYEGQTGPLLRSFLTGLVLADTSVTYDGTTRSGATTAVAGVQGSAASGRNAGTHATGYYSGQQGYDISGGSLAIGKASLVLTTSDVTRTYDGTTDAAGAAVATGGTQVFGGDSLSGGTYAFTSKNAGTGNRVVTVAGVTVDDGNGGGNYDVTYVNNTTSTINKASLVITTSDVTRTYDGTTDATGTAVATSGTQVFTGDSLSGGTYAFTGKNAGTGNKTVTVSGVTVNDGNGGGNYDVTYANNTTSTINKASLVITTSDVTRTYDGTTDATGTAVATSGTQVFTGDSLSGGTYAFTNKNAGAGNKVVTVAGVTVADGNGGGNYDVTYANNTTSTITKAALVVTTSDVVRTYDGTTDATGTAVATGGTQVFTGDSLSGGTYAFTGKNAGTGNKTVTVSGVTVNDGNGGGNYDVTYANNTTSTINKASLVITTSDVTRTYDGTTDANGTAVATGGTQVFTGDSLSGGTYAFTNKNAGAGNKVVTVSGVTVNDGNGGGNYDVIYSNNTTSTINKAALVITTSDVTRTYDGTTDATGTAVATGGTQVFTGDSLSGGTYAFTNRNAGTGNKVVTVGGVTVNDGNGGGNYDVTHANNTTSTINKASLVVTTSDITRTYDGTTNATGTAVATGGTQVFTGDSLSGGTYAFTNKNAGAGNKVVTVSGVTVTDGNGGGNYDVTYASNTTSTIDKAGLVLTTTDVSRVYDGTTGANGSAIATSGTQVFTGDSLSGGTYAFTDKNVGAGNKVVTVGGVTVNDGNGGGNYDITYVNNTTSTITKAALVVTTSDVVRTYDGTTNATGTAVATGGTQVFTGDSLSGGTYAFTNRNAGTGNKVVTVGGVTVNDGNGGGNYDVTYANNTTSTINKASLVITTTDVTRTYDGTMDANGSAVATGGTQVFTGDSLSGGTYAFTNKNAGIGNKVVTVAGVTVNDGNGGGNYDVTYANNTTSTISKASLAVTATGVDKVYDGTTAATVIYGDNRIAGDVLDFTGTATFADRNAGGGIAVAVSGIAATGADAGNYDLVATTASTSADITPKALTVTANDDSRTAGAAAYAGGNGVTYGGFAAGDTASVLGGALVYGGTAQGASAPGTYSITAGGLTSGNYTLAFVAGVLTIYPATAQPPAPDVPSYPVPADALRGELAYQSRLDGSFNARVDLAALDPRSVLITVRECGVRLPPTLVPPNCAR